MSGKNSAYGARLSALRESMEAQGLDGFILSHADAFQSEYPPPSARRLEWLTGFSGSAGVAAVLGSKAVVMSDNRYTIQLAQQTDRALYEVGDVADGGLAKWLCANGKKGQVVGFDPWLFTIKQIDELQEKVAAGGITLKAAQENPVDAIWQGKPQDPQGQVTLFPESVAGLTLRQKRAMIAEAVAKAGGDAVILTRPDSVCWLLNVRGGDVEYSPLVLSYAILYADGGRVDWFAGAGKVPEAVVVHLGGDVRILEPSALSEAIEKLKGKVLLDFRHAPARFRTALEESKISFADFADPCVLPKACKTKTEQAAIEKAHIADGVAMVRFLAWLDREAPKGALTEIEVADKLESFRRMDTHYKGPSFATIAGFGPNGAIVHYRASEKTNRKIKPPGILLLDSGGQYHWGTTDITRTISIGEPTEEMRRNFTLVLKGHIAVAMAQFAEGTQGAQIDALARQALKGAGLDYGHGTGHGVGCYLQVHEEAASLSPRGKESIRAGMLLSNEPGYYKEGAYGIRIENLVLAEEIERGMLGFRTVTLAPIDRRLIDAGMLSGDECSWLNSYHARVRDVLMPLLDKEAAVWIEKNTRPL
ncbi:MAG TPA: hypothetical protein DEA55_10795 [Rhodospirillaceae bacterium]|nr:hypothetical protein [Rhodospirillaceae bacterium]